MRRKLVWAAWGLLVMLVFGVAVAAKEFSLPEVRIVARVTPDGSIVVSETRTYHFLGSFGWASMWLPTSGSQVIEDIIVAEEGQRYSESGSEAPGTFQVTTARGRTDIKWFYRAENERRSFTISYRVRNAVRVYSDVAELYWQFVGNGWEVPTKHAVVVVDLPRAAPAGSVRAWGHGPLHGTVRLLDTSRVQWEVHNLPARTFLEARLVFPSSLVPEAAEVESRPGLPVILAEEEQWASEANRVRNRAKLDGQVALFALLLVTLASVLYWNRYSRPYPSEFKSRYYRELPADYPPAVAGIIWRGYSGAQDMAATVLDLLRRGYLAVEPLAHPSGRRSRSTDFALSLSKERSEADLSEHERLVLELLFEAVAGWLPPGEPVTTSSIRRYARAKTTSFNSWHRRWKEAARGLAARCEVYDTSNRPGRVGAGVAAALLAAAGAALLAGGSYALTGVSLLAGALVAVLLAKFGRRRTAQAQTEHLKWRAFRRFLRDFSNMEAAPVLAVAIWEHYLVYAVVLGVAREVIRQLQVLTPELRNDPGYASSWLFTGMATTGEHGTGSLCSAFVSSVQAALSHSSSGSGSGGGFSSGGGGGGGGGGGSAG